MTSTFECAICCSNYSYNPSAVRKTRKSVCPCTCPKCSYTVCKPCQTQYAKGDCANCHFEFPRSFVAENLGADFYKDVVVPTIIRELMVEQRVNLETVDVQGMVSWLRQCEDIRKNSRFGKRQEFPPKPTQTGVTLSTKYLCPIGDCRGMIVGTTCNVCKEVCCVHCHEKLLDGSHVCNEDAKLVISESKPCPKCFSLIHKSDGCDAMHCTSCGTRFNWVTLALNEQNSNNHYLNSKIFGVRLNGVRPNENGDDDFCIFSNRLDRVPRDAIERYASESVFAHGEHSVVACPSELIRFLYTITGAVRNYKIRKFDENVLIMNLQSRTHDLRVQYLMKKISEKVWEQRVYYYHTQYKAYMIHADIVNVYLSVTDGFQIEVRDAIQRNASMEVYEDIVVRFKQLTTICNQSFTELHKDYPIDSTQLYIRNMDDSDETVLDDCGFYIKSQSSSDSVAALNPDAKEIVLYEYQNTHTEQLGYILLTSHYALDFSMLGAGKSYTAMHLYKTLEYTNGLVIAPASVVGKWKELVQIHGLVGVEVYSFNELSGSIGKKQRVGHLIRRVDTLTPQGNVVGYTITSQMRQYIRNGMFLIIDEIQNIKNDGAAQTRACKELVSAIHTEFQTTNGATKSRALLISGSPIDQAVQTIQFFKTIGIMTRPELTQFDIGEFSRRRYQANASQANASQANANDPIGNIATGLHEIRTYCETLNPQVTALVKALATKCPIEECYQLFVQVIKPHCSKAMVVVGNDYRVRKFNGMFDLIVPVPDTTEQDTTEPDTTEPDTTEPDTAEHPCLNLLINGIRRLQLCMRNRREDGQELNGVELFAAMQKALLMIETAKIPIMVKLIREKMAQNPMCKIVLACNYSQTITDLVRELGDEFDPLVLNGSVPSKNRQDILRPFQEPNLTRRLLIGNVHVLSSGIDLDDKDGSYPRVCLVSPNYNTIDLYQISYRFLRALDTKSDSEMYMIYVKNYTELHLIKSLAAKGTVMKNVTNEQANLANILFPCDFSEHVHPEPTDPEAWNAECDVIFSNLA